LYLIVVANYNDYMLPSLSLILLLIFSKSLVACSIYPTFIYVTD